MALSNLNDVTKWHAQILDWVSIYYSTSAVAGSTVHQMTISEVIAKESSLSVTPVYSPTKSSVGTERPVAYRMDLDLRVAQNNFPDFRENLDNLYRGGWVTDLDIRFVGSGGTYNFSFEPTGKTIWVKPEIKTDNDGIPLLSIKASVIIPIKSFASQSLIIQTA